MFDLDDLLDPSTPEGLVLAAGSGVLDDDRACDCDCDCTRFAAWPDELCEACQEGRHRDPFDPEDQR
jgi:hypothetical protein